MKSTLFQCFDGILNRFKLPRPWFRVSQKRKLWRSSSRLSFVHNRHPMTTLLKDWDCMMMAYARVESMCPDMWGLGTGNHQLSKPGWNRSPPGRHPRGVLWCFGWGNQGQDVHDGHADTMRQSHASLTVLAWPKGWLHLGCILCFANSSHPLRSLTIYSWYSLRRIVAALDASSTASSVLFIGAKDAVVLAM